VTKRERRGEEKHEKKSEIGEKGEKVGVVVLSRRE